MRTDDKKVRSGFCWHPLAIMAICRKGLKKYSVNKFFPPTMALAGPVLQNCTKTDNTSSTSSSSTSTSSSTSSSSSSGHLGWVSLTSHEEIVTFNLEKYSNIPPKRLWLLIWPSSLETGDTPRLGGDSAKVWLGRRCFTFTLFFPDDHYGLLQADNGWWINSSSHCSWIINCGESVKTGEKWIVS